MSQALQLHGSIILLEALLVAIAAIALFRRYSGLASLVLATAAATTATYVFSPGLMSFDSLRQFAQATGAEPLNNFHPVVMTYIWGALMSALHYPGAMLLFFQLLHWSAAATLSIAIARSAWARVLILAVLGLWPPTAILSLHVWKDVGMVETMALAVGLMVLHTRCRSPWLPAAALLMLLLSTLFRHNAIVATLPLATFACFQLAVHLHPARARYGAMLTAFWIGALALASYILDAPASKDNPLPTLLLWDIAAISVEVNEDLFPPYYGHLVDGDILEAVKGVYSPDTNHTTYTAISPYPTGVTNVEMVRDWLAIVIAHPVAYAKHRWHVVQTMLGLRSEVYYPFHWGIDQNDFGLTTDTRSPDDMWSILTVFDKVAKWPTHRVWIYVLALFATLSFSLSRVARPSRTETDGLILTVSISGLLLMASMLVITVAADFRYVGWVITSALIASALSLRSLMHQSDVPSNSAARTAPKS